MAFIIKNYLEINIERAASENYDIYEAENFNTFIAGATLLGRDINSILEGNRETLATFIQILDDELKLEDESPLLNQIIETHKNIEYDIVAEALLIQYSLFGSSKSFSFIALSFSPYSDQLQVFIK